MNRKQELQRLTAELQAARNNHDVLKIVQMIGLMIEDARDALVATDREGHDAARSRVVTLESMRKILTQPSMAEMQAPYTTTKE